MNELSDKYEFILINNLKVAIRPLLSKLKPVVFSNVSPDIPNHVLEDFLEKLNVKRGSQVSGVRATITKEGYNHVPSFRRQVFVKPEDIAKIPETFKINLNEINYFVYASTDTLQCFSKNPYQYV